MGKKTAKGGVVKKVQVDWSKTYRVEDTKTTYMLAYGEFPYLDLDMDEEFDTLEEAEKEAGKVSYASVVQKTVRTNYNAPFNREANDPFDSLW